MTSVLKTEVRKHRGFESYSMRSNNKKEVQNMKEKFEKATVDIVKFDDDIITTSGHQCGCPWGNQSGNNNTTKPPFPWFPWFWW